MLKMKTLIILILLLLPIGLMSQNRKTDEREITEEMRYSAEKKFNSWALSAGYGPFWMYTDITNYKVFPKRLHLSPSIILSKQLVPALALDLQYLKGDMFGENGAHYFKGDLHELSLNATFYINQMTVAPGPINDRWNFFVKVGAGTTMFRNRMYHTIDDSFVREIDLGNPSNRFMVTGYDRSDPERKTDRKVEINVPATVGVMYRINKSFDISWETSMHFSANDYLDNIYSGSTNDKYFFSGLYLSYKIGKKDKRHLRWTYRGLGFDLFGRQKKDPLITPVDIFENELNRYIDGRPIDRHTVEIRESVTTIYQQTFIRTIFFPEGGDITFNDEDIVYMAETVIQLHANEGATLELLGHVNDNDQGNHDELSKAQCDKVLDFLVNELGGDASRIKISSLGSSDPLATGEDAPTEVKEFANRRVDMLIVFP